MTNKLILPRELRDFEETIRSTAKPFIKILPQKASETSWWQSKIGGKPYLPKNATYPSDLEGNHLFFLAQINFEEMPFLPPFPKKGILQFFIFDDPFYGMEINDPYSQDGFRVVYYENLIQDENQLVLDFSFLRNFMPDPIDSTVSFPLNFQLDEEFVPTSDCHFGQLLGEDFFVQFGEKEWDLWTDYNQTIRSAGHKMGGYAHFTQEDPRDEGTSYLQLLFQLDSDSNIRCNWGDLGIANFFIDPENLRRKDFSKILYNWDSP